MLEKIEGTIVNVQSRNSGNNGHTRQDEDTKKNKQTNKQTKTKQKTNKQTNKQQDRTEQKIKKMSNT